MIKKTNIKTRVSAKFKVLKMLMYCNRKNVYSTIQTGTHQVGVTGYGGSFKMDIL